MVERDRVERISAMPHPQETRADSEPHPPKKSPTFLPAFSRRSQSTLQRLNLRLLLGNERCHA